MANEINATIQLTCTNGDYATSFSYSDSIDQNAVGASSGIQVIGTSAELLSVGDVSNAGIIILRNLDAVNFLTWGYSDTGTLRVVGKIKAGEAQLFRLATTSILCKADTAPINLNYIVLAD